MLSAIRAAVGPNYPLLFDGGLRSGEDIVKALASGADFVMLGRPFLYAMAAGGISGVTSYLDSLTSELAIVLAQVGLKRIDDVNETILASPSSRRSCGTESILLRGSGVAQ